MNKAFFILVALLFFPVGVYGQVAISALPPATVLSGGEAIPCVQSGVTRRCAATQIKAYTTNSVSSYGALCDGSTDDTAAIQAAITAASAATNGGVVYFPATGFPCITSATLVMGKYITLRGSTTAGPSGTYTSGIAYTGLGDAIKSTSPINSSTSVNDTVEDMKIVCSNASNAGAGYDDVGGTFVHIKNAMVLLCAYGVIFDQTELGDIDLSNFSGNKLGGVWLVNGADHTPLASINYTNRISIEHTQFNVLSTGSGIVDDGGASHVFMANNLNAGSNGIRVASAQGLVIDGNEFETATGAEILFTNLTSLGTAVGPSYAVSVRGNNISPTAGQSSIQSIIGPTTLSVSDNFFVATTGGLPEISGGSNITTLSLGLNYTNGAVLLGGTPGSLFNTQAGTAFTAPSYIAGATSGVTCAGAPTVAFASTGGIVTHC